MNKEGLGLTQGASYARGSVTAPVTIYQFSEFQCPFCKRVEPTLKEVLGRYGDQVRIVFKNFPIASHRNARTAAEAALAAGAQGKFWEMHDRMFAHQKQLDRASLSIYAREIGLDVAKFDAELDSHKYAPQMEGEISEGVNAGVTGTPMFIINGRVLNGAQPAASFHRVIDEALARSARP